MFILKICRSLKLHYGVLGGGITKALPGPFMTHTENRVLTEETEFLTNSADGVGLCIAKNKKSKIKTKTKKQKQKKQNKTKQKKKPRKKKQQKQETNKKNGPNKTKQDKKQTNKQTKTKTKNIR